MAKLISLEHPGTILKEEFVEAFGLTPYAISKETGITQTALGEILKGKRNISAVNALKLSKFFGVSESYFINLQTKYSIDIAKEKEKKSLAKIIPFRRKGSDSMELLEA
jgi:addiction module HigA family antidote